MVLVVWVWYAYDEAPASFEERGGASRVSRVTTQQTVGRTEVEGEGILDGQPDGEQAVVRESQEHLCVCLCLWVCLFCFGGVWVCRLGLCVGVLLGCGGCMTGWDVIHHI